MCQAAVSGAARQAEKVRDNILPKIMAAPEGHSELFQREIAKYDSLKADITGVPPPPPAPGMSCALAHAA